MLNRGAASYHSYLSYFSYLSYLSPLFAEKYYICVLK